MAAWVAWLLLLPPLQLLSICHTLVLAANRLKYPINMPRDRCALPTTISSNAHTSTALLPHCPSLPSDALRSHPYCALILTALSSSLRSHPRCALILTALSSSLRSHPYCALILTALSLTASSFSTLSHQCSCVILSGGRSVALLLAAANPLIQLGVGPDSLTGRAVRCLLPGCRGRHQMATEQNGVVADAAQQSPQISI